MINDVDLGFNELLSSLKGISGKYIAVGVFDSDVATYAMANEFGTEHIPQRSFLRSTMDENQGAIVQEYIRAYNETNDFDLAMERTGEFIKEKVVAKILEGDFTPNAISTVKQKGSSSPLIDTGTLVNSIDYVVKDE